MEEVFKQSFNYAQIKLFRNYSNLNINPILRKVDTDDLFDEENENVFQPVITKKHMMSKSGYILKLFSRDNKKRFFYADIKDLIPVNENDSSYLIHRGEYLPFQRIKLTHMGYDWFETTKDKHIKRHYNNPFAQIKIHKIERWIKKDGDKLIMKYYHHTRERCINCIYFTKRTTSMTITFNLRTGNFTTISFAKAYKSKHASFHTNSFISLKHSLNTIYNTINIPRPLSTSSFRDQFDKEFDTELFHHRVRKAFNFNNVSLLKLINTPPSKIFLEKSHLAMVTLDFINDWTSKFIELKKIKVPNHCARLIKNFYPTERYLKKNDRKLVAAILDRFGVKSNITVKILHKYPDINMLALVRLCYLFGKNYPKYVGNINLEFFERYTIREKEDDGYSKNILLDDNNPRFMDLRESEKSNLIKVINDYITNLGIYDIVSNHSLVDYVYDHFNMIQKVREYYPDIRMTARTYETFSQEHIELSEIEQTIKKGFSIQYIFNEQTIHTIEKPIEIHRLGDIDITKPYGDFANITHQIFIPKILKTSEEYSEEGSYMHHCVSSYINTETSMIVSLRTEKERVTCEFYIKNRSCVQARYFNNQDPPEHFKDALIELNRRIRDCSTPLNSLEKKRIRLQINGKDVIPEIQEAYTILDNDLDLPFDI